MWKGKWLIMLPVDSLMGALAIFKNAEPLTQHPIPGIHAHWFPSMHG